MRQLFRELKRRNVYRVAATYAVVAFVTLQAARLIFPATTLEGLYDKLVVLVFVGFPIALVIAWAFELTPEGVRRTREAEPPETGPEHAEDRRSRSRLATKALAGLGLVAVTLAGGWYLLGGEGEAGPGDGPSNEPGSRPAMGSEPPSPGDEDFVASVAVLPFDHTGAPEDDYLSEGITEMITAKLAQVPHLKVISRTSVVALEDSRLTIPRIADTLNVQHVLEGTVQRFGSATRVTVQLIEAETDAHLWAQTYTQDRTDLFQLQDEIAREVTRALLTTMPRLRASGLTSPAAASGIYQQYLQGRHFLHERTHEGLSRAIESFRRAAEIDPSYAPAYAGLAMASGLWVTYGYDGELGHYTAYARGLAAADRAVTRDSSIAEAYSARGYILTKAWAPPGGVDENFERALKLLPNSADVHGWYAHFLVREKEFEEAVSEAQQAIELDPIAPGRRTGFALDALGARRNELTLREARRALALEPGLLLPKALEGMALLLTDRAGECLELDLERRAGVRAMCLYAVGREDEARVLADSLITVAETWDEEGEYSPVVVLGDIASYFAWTGQTEEAVKWLRRTYEVSPSGLDFRIVYSGIFDPVREDPVFRAAWDRLQTTIWERVRKTDAVLYPPGAKSDSATRAVRADE